jgi:anti-sigma-K factor RskA
MKPPFRPGVLTRREPHTLAGAYAMDAISAPDRSRFERHLGRCQECAQEIASLREATARLATATAVTPPPELKERVMAAVATTRPRPATAAADEPARVGRPGPLRAGAWLAAQGWRVRLTVAAGAVAAVVVLAAAVILGTSDGAMRQQLHQAQDSSQQIAAVLTARDATMMTAAVTGGGTVTIVMSHAMGKLVFTAAGLPALPASRGYELWLVGPAGDRSAGMLPPGRGQMAGPLVAAGLRPGDHLALSAEPAGGTSQPTTPMMLDLAL